MAWRVGARPDGGGDKGPTTSLIVTVIACGLAILAGPAVGVADAGPSDYQIGPQDVLSVAVWNQDDLGGHYTVEADGGFTFPLVGRVHAGGLTVRALEQALTNLLADGFFKNPQVTISVEAYRSQRIFVVGEVRSPGTYPLRGGMTLIEALASAGSTTDRASHDALVVQRPASGNAPSSAAAPSTANTESGLDSSDPTELGPTLPEEAASQNATVLTVDVDALQSGQITQDVNLRDGDTIFVPRAETIFVFGEVNSPGEFAMRRATTVLQALALAGGVTEYGATNRIKVIRVDDGDGAQQEIKVDLNDRIQAGDTIVVPERFF